MHNEFWAAYHQAKDVQPATRPSETQTLRATFEADSLPLSSFLRRLSADYGVSVVASESLDSKTITMTAHDVPVTDILITVARRFDVQLTRVGSVYYLGTLRGEDRAVLVRKVTSVAPDTLREMLAVYNSDSGRVTVSPDGVAVFGDRVEVLDKVNRMLDDLSQVRLQAWAIQAFLIEVGNDFSSDYAVDGATAIDIAAVVGTASAGGPSFSAKATLSALLRASRKSSSVKTQTCPMIIVSEGATASLVDGQTVRTERKTTSDSGTVTTTGFDTIDAGLRYRVTLRPLAQTEAMLDYSYKEITILKYVNNLPVTSDLTFETRTVVTDGGVYLLGQVEQSLERQQNESGISPSQQRERNKRTVQLWVRVLRIGSPPASNLPLEAATTQPHATTPN